MKVFEILLSTTLLDLGYDLDCVIWGDFKTLLTLVWNAPLIVLNSIVVCGRVVSHRITSLVLVNLHVRLLCLGLLLSLLGSLWDRCHICKPLVASSIVELHHQQ